MRRVGEVALQSDLRYRLVGRDEKQARMHEALFDEPLVGRLVEVAFELLLERCEAAVALAGQLVDGDVAEYIFIYGLLEVLLGHVHVAEYFGLEAALLLRDDEIYQLGHFDVLGGLVVGEEVVSDILIGGGEEVLHGIGGGIYHMAVLTTLLARVRVGYVELVGHVEVRENFGQLFGGVVEDYLLERAAVLGNILSVVVPGAEVEHIALSHLVTRVAIVDILFAPQYIADAMSGQIV